MTDNNEENKTNFCLWQAQAFIEYISKLGIKDKDELLENFHHWSESKQFLEEDAECIQKLVEKFWQEKEKQIAELKWTKRRSKNRIKKADKQQMLFEFIDISPGESGKKKERQGMLNCCLPTQSDGERDS